MKFQKEDELKEYAKGLLYQIIPNDSWSNVCYTYRISNKLAGSVYKIALNDKLPEELKDHLFCIELAHIRRQHYAAKQTLDFRFSAPKIKAVYNKLKPLFDDPVSDIDNMYDIFEDYVFKMLRDWEVFTNDFTEEEVRYLDTLYPDECIIDGQPVIHLLPQDVGYPPGLTANEYLILILQNPEQWFTNQMSAMQQAMDDLKQRKQNNGTQGGCNTNQSGATSSGGGADDINHNKEDRERPKKNPPQNQQNGQNGQKGGQSGQSGQQNQQPQNQQGNQNSQNQNSQNQNGQDDQGMGSSQQNQDAAANTQQQEWKDGKDSDGGSNGSSGKQSNNDKSKQTDSSSKGSGKGDADDKSEQDEQSSGGSSDSQEEIGDEGNKDESRSGGSSSGSDKGDSDDADGENQASGSGTSDEDNGDDGSESESSNSGKTSSDNTEDSEDTSGETSGEEGTESDSEAGDGEPSGDGSEGSDGDTSVSDGNDGERKELTKEELDELIKQFIQKAVSDYQKMLEIKDEQEADSNSLKGYSRDGGGGAGNGTVLVDKCTNWIDFEGLEKEIRELMINRCVTVSKRDLLYNYNRGRGCGDVLSPRYREQTTYDEVPMTVVLDVSGSISDKNILGFCNIFKNVSKTCGKKCKIVMWDTGLRAIYDSGDDIKAVSGGGTDIGAGIDYVRKNFQPSEIGNLFVVSDCEDRLEDWSLEGFNQPYLVCWSSMDVIKNYTGSLFDEFVDSFEKILVKK